MEKQLKKNTNRQRDQDGVKVFSKNKCSLSEVDCPVFFGMILLFFVSFEEGVRVREGRRQRSIDEERKYTKSK